MKNVAEGLAKYYTLSVQAYRNWNELGKSEVPYSIHCGIHPGGIEIGQFQSLDLMTEFVIDQAKIEPGSTILDAGCGVGSIAHRIAQQKQSCKVLGINITPSQLRTANMFKEGSGLSNLHFIQNSYNEITLPQNTVDRVIFCESLGHSPDQAQTLSE